MASPGLALEGLTIERLRDGKLGDHPEIDLAGLTVNDMIQWDGTNWIPVTGPAPAPHALGSHIDVIITTPTTGDVLRFNGTNWVNAVGDEPLAHAASHMIGGSDPVTSLDPLTVDLNLGGNLITNVLNILRGVPSSGLAISGGTTAVLGGNVIFRGETGTPANDIELREAAVVKLRWDSSVPQWDFQGLNIGGVGDITMTSTTSSIHHSLDNQSLIISGGTTRDLGGNIRLFAQTTIGASNDIQFRSGTVVKLKWDDSVPEWNFQGNTIANAVFSVDANTLTGTTLASNVVFSSLTSFGNLTGLTTDVLRISSESGIHRTSTSGALFISGGSSIVLGANLLLHGEADVPPNDILIRTGTTVRLKWDDASPQEWNFQGLNVNNIGTLTATTLSITNLTVTGTLTVATLNASGGTMTFQTGGVNEVSLTSAKFGPTTSGGTTLGTAGQAWGNAFMATVLLGTTVVATGAPRLDVVGPSAAAVTAVFSDVSPNATNKLIKIGARHRNNVEEPVGMIVMDNLSTTNTMRLGGGTSAFNAITLFQIYTAANFNTTTGTVRFSIDSAGAANFQGNTVTAGSFVGSAAVSALTGTTLPGNVVFSSLTSFGNLTGLTTDVLRISSESGIHRTSTSGALFISGGSSIVLGANLLLHGEADVPPNDILIRTGTTVRLKWDDASPQEWNFQGLNVNNIGTLTATTLSSLVTLTVTGTSTLNRIIISGTQGIVRSVATDALVLSGGTTVALGANIVLRGQTGSPANDIELRVAGSVKSRWDNSQTRWEFSGDLVPSSAGGSGLGTHQVLPWGDIQIGTTIWFHTGATRRFAIVSDALGVLKFFDNDASTVRAMITSGGNVLIGTTIAATGAPRLDVVGSNAATNPTLVLSDRVTNAAQKEAILGVRHFTNAQEAFTVFDAIAASATNVLRIGGGSGIGNAATAIEFYAASTSVTLTGTLQMAIGDNFIEAKTQIGALQHAIGASGSGTKIFNCNTSNSQTIENTGSPTIQVDNERTGFIYVLKIIAKAGGSATGWTWPGIFRWPGGGKPTLTTTLNRTDIITFYWDAATNDFIAVSSLNHF